MHPGDNFQDDSAVGRPEWLADRARHVSKAMSFLAPCGPQTPPALCQDKPGFDRTAFHRTFNDSVTAFFRARLAAPPAR
jgi:hypothetical protein